MLCDPRSVRRGKLKSNTSAAGRGTTVSGLFVRARRCDISGTAAFGSIAVCNATAPSLGGKNASCCYLATASSTFRLRMHTCDCEMWKNNSRGTEVKCQCFRMRGRFKGREQTKVPELWLTDLYLLPNARDTGSKAITAACFSGQPKPSCFHDAHTPVTVTYCRWTLHNVFHMHTSKAISFSLSHGIIYLQEEREE